MSSSPLKIKKGMYVILKYDISESLHRYGINREKRKYGGQIRQVSCVKNDEIFLKRNSHEKTSFRSKRDSWKFHISDIAEIVSEENLKNIKEEEYTFDPKQLVTC